MLGIIPGWFLYFFWDILFYKMNGKYVLRFILQDVSLKQALWWRPKAKRKCAALFSVCCSLFFSHFPFMRTSFLKLWQSRYGEQGFHKGQRHFEEWKWLEKEERHWISDQYLTVKCVLDKQSLGVEVLVKMPIWILFPRTFQELLVNSISVVTIYLKGSTWCLW